MKYRFDLDRAISSWRNTLRYQDSVDSQDIDELEFHVRDQVKALMITGKSEEAAFNRAVSEMGLVHQIDEEYGKNYSLSTRIATRLSMIRYYVTLAYRNLKKDKLSSSINVLGLALSVSICVVIFLYVQGGSNIDRFHENGAQGRAKG